MQNAADRFPDPTLDLARRVDESDRRAMIALADAIQPERRPRPHEASASRFRATCALAELRIRIVA